MVKLSVVIPAYNEEKYLPKLLKSLSRQTFKDFEVIIADNNSVDKTEKRALKFRKKLNLQVTHCKKQGPGPARNAGAKLASGDYLLFLDADVVLPRVFIKSALSEFESRFLSIANCLVWPMGKSVVNTLLHLGANLIMLFSHAVKPHSGGYCILITKRLHERIKGFDESMSLSEDCDYFERGCAIGKHATLENTKLFMSTRRFGKEGKAGLVTKALLGYANKVICKNRQLVDYKFGKW